MRIIEAESPVRVALTFLFIGVVGGAGVVLVLLGGWQ